MAEELSSNWGGSYNGYPSKGGRRKGSMSRLFQRVFGQCVAFYGIFPRTRVVAKNDKMSGDAGKIERMIAAGRHECIRQRTPPWDTSRRRKTIG